MYLEHGYGGQPGRDYTRRDWIVDCGLAASVTMLLFAIGLLAFG